MLQKLSIGLVIAFLAYLVIRIFSKKKDSPSSVQKAFDQEFSNSSYSNSKDNWLAVSKMETAGWTSRLFVNGLNLWGMKRARKRPNTQLPFEQTGVPGRDKTLFQKLFPNVDQLQKEGVKNFLTNPLPPGDDVNLGIVSEWAKYKNLNDAVKDIILWMEYTKFPKEKLSLRDHVEEMKKRSYFVGESLDSYLGKVIAWQNRNLA